ncbi:MAG: transposase [Candidatus Bathyarchaeia archaeon]
MLKLFDSLDFKPIWGLLNEPYHDSGPGRPYYSPEAVIKALMLQRFMRIPSERVLAEKLAMCRYYRRVCGFRRKTPSRGCFTYFRRDRFKEETFKKAFNFVVGQAVALGAVRGTALAIDSTAFKAYSAREAEKGKSDPDADVGWGWKNLHFRV